MRLFTTLGLLPMLLVLTVFSLGQTASFAEAQSAIPEGLQNCAGLFDPVGVPSDDDGADGATYTFADGYVPPKVGDTSFYYKCYTGYAVRMNAVTHVPDWSAENITPELSQGSATRSNKFTDEKSPPGYSSSDSDFDHSNFDRGHQTPAGDFNGSQELKNKTFMMSNMGPQYGPCYNRGIWKNLEAAVKQLVKTRGRLIVFTGPIYNGKLKSISDVSDQKDAHVAIPDEYFKIIYAPDSNRITAIRIPHKPQCGVDFHASEFLTSVKAIEEVTGFEFFPNFPARNKQLLESQKNPFWTW